MTFDEVLDQIRELLRQRGRLTYGAVKRRFALDEAYLEDIKGELIEAEQVAKDEEGKVLVWTGNNSLASSVQRLASEGQERAPLLQTLDSRPRDSRLDVVERRQLTVEFIDLVGSTALSARLDPEELREIIRIYQKTSVEVIERYGGHVAQYLGDGLLVYFGYPSAHEDDAARAIRAGLEIIEALRTQVPSPLVGEGQGEGVTMSAVYTPHPNLPPPGGKELRKLQVRIGIHTGPVVVGEMGGGERREQLALGETPNIAARVQGIAESDTVVMSTATHRLVQGLFECQDLGLQTLKGIAMPLSLYRVIGESVAQSRFEVAVRTGLTPLVGREEELSVLQRRWSQAKDSAGHVVLLSGEPGIGKSRLVQELKEHVSAEGATRIEFRCSPYHQNSALYPLIDHLQRLLQFAREDSPEEKLRKLAVGARHAVPLPLGIPTTLQDALMVRLDRLNTAKEIAQLGATIGREFSYEVLHAVSPLDEGSLPQGLRQLVEVELLYQRGLLPQATYLFKHALIQDTAYHSLLKSKRQQLHQQIAQILEAQFPETKETQPELVAHHYTEAGLVGQAIPYWQRAGQKASQRSAYVEAAAHLSGKLKVQSRKSKNKKRKNVF